MTHTQFPCYKNAFPEPRARPVSLYALKEKHGSRTGVTLNYTRAHLLRILYCIIAAILLSAPPLSAEGLLGAGIHIGGHYDVGMVGSYNPDFKVNPQLNLLAGFALKAEYRFLFLRTGIDTAMAVNKGRVMDNTASTGSTDLIQSYKIIYTAIPCFAGLAFPIHDVGEFYLGGGAAYFLGRGRVTSSAGQSFKTEAFGPGVLAGVQISLTPSFRVYIEWEYIDARSGAAVNTQTAIGWKNFYADFTGHRLMLGLMYYAW